MFRFCENPVQRHNAHRAKNRGTGGDAGQESVDKLILDLLIAANDAVLDLFVAAYHGVLNFLVGVCKFLHILFSFIPTPVGFSFCSIIGL